MSVWLSERDLTLNTDTLAFEILRDGMRAVATLTDKRSGRSWGPAPLVTLDVHDKALRRVVCADDWRVVNTRIVENGLHVMIVSPPHGIEVGIWLRLVDGELSVMVAPAEIYERDNRIYRLFAIDILPGLITVDDGSLLLPINTGLICPTAHAPEVRDRFLIYGEQDRWELTPSLPFCAAWDTRGGLVALAREGACDAECRVGTDGHGIGSCGFAASLRRTWIDPVDYGNREIRFAPIPPKSDPVAFCARRVRRHVIDDLGKRTLDERAAESPEVAYLLDAYIMKLFFGIENVGYMMEGKKVHDPGSFQNYMTFAEASANLRRIKDTGIDHVLTQCTGWNTRGHDGLYPTRFPIEERLGGDSGFREMIRGGNDLGFNMQVHDNFMMQILASPDFDRDHTVIDIYGEPLIHGGWAGGPEVSAWPLAMPDERIGGHMQRMKAYGLKGMLYVDYMQQPLEVNYHPKYKGSRSACARGQVRIIEEGRRIFGSCGTEFGFLPCAIAADHISTCGESWHLDWCRPEWPITKLIDQKNVAPVWQMAMSGLVALEAREGVSWRNTMRCVLYGGVPRDEWCVRPGVLPVLDDERITAQKAVYDLCVGRFGHLKRLEIVRACRLADDVHETEFGDGTRVIADFAKGRLEVNDKVIEKPVVLT